jgi:hypothetical protein
MIKLLGAEYMRVLDRKSTHLVGQSHILPAQSSSSTHLYLNPRSLSEMASYDVASNMCLALAFGMLGVQRPQVGAGGAEGRSVVGPGRGYSSPCRLAFDARYEGSKYAR